MGIEVGFSDQKFETRSVVRDWGNESADEMH